MTDWFEVNFDGLVGPTHNYAGLSWGNLASESNHGRASRPRQAALQGLAKMKHLTQMGLVQGVFPPHERPNTYFLRELGFTGSDAAIIAQAAKQAPELLAVASSASSMWTANAGTVSPAPDTTDQRTHFTAANLCSLTHRAQEADFTSHMLQSIFADTTHFAHHKPLLGAPHLGDEGAANHTRFSNGYGAPGVEFFVYGKHAYNGEAPAPHRFPARQTREASQAIVRLHGLPEKRVVYAQQHPEAIDHGVFHNDVIAVGNGNVLLYHEQAFLDTDTVLTEIADKLAPTEFIPIMVPAAQVSVQDAVRSYLFNSQLINLPEGGMALITPSECADTPSVKSFLDKLLASNGPIRRIEIMDVRESMRNGGGPACLRLRVVLNEQSLQALSGRVILDDSLYQDLTSWVEKHYREELLPKDLADPKLLEESRTALDHLTQILQLGSLYPFQQV